MDECFICMDETVSSPMYCLFYENCGCNPRVHRVCQDRYRAADMMAGGRCIICRTVGSNVCVDVERECLDFNGTTRYIPVEVEVRTPLVNDGNRVRRLKKGRMFYGILLVLLTLVMLMVLQMLFFKD